MHASISWAAECLCGGQGGDAIYMPPGARTHPRACPRTGRRARRRRTGPGRRSRRPPGSACARAHGHRGAGAGLGGRVGAWRGSRAYGGQTEPRSPDSKRRLRSDAQARPGRGGSAGAALQTGGGRRRAHRWRPKCSARSRAASLSSYLEAAAAAAATEPLSVFAPYASQPVRPARTGAFGWCALGAFSWTFLSSAAPAAVPAETPVSV